MRVNEELAVSTPNILLVPYDPHHVERYHEWMQNEDLREATASDLLTLDEEYENQQSWRTAHDKLTFIVCLPTTDTNSGATSPIHAGADDAPPRMAGDVNLFLTSDDINDGDDDGDDISKAENCICGEIDIMIAAPEHRRRGLGGAAVRAFLRFLAGHHDAVMAEYARGADCGARLTKLVAKINGGNAGSIRLFENLGFRRDGEPNYFNEISMVLVNSPPLAAAAAKGALPRIGDLDGEAGSVGYRECFYDRSRLKK
ncbi:acetyltransferase domain-containing protein [Xylaria digitata]|nr:acetyltransferase domain-containing protein [Xylaria digitata]